MKSLRFLAASEITGGAFLLVGIIATWHNSKIPMWYQIASFVLALYAIVAGIFLWKKTPLGHWLSLVLQAIQFFQIVTSTFILKILVGFHVSLFVFAVGGLNVTPGVAGSFGLWGTGHTQNPGIGINLLAVASIFLLLIGIKGILRNAATAKLVQA